MKVLIADDNAGFRSDLQRYLKHQRGVKVVGQARDGLEAEYFVGSLHPDLVLLDISMPRVGGFEVAKHIKASFPETKIVFLTVHEEKTYRALAELLEVDGFVCKSELDRKLPVVLRKISRGNRRRH